MNAKPIAEHHNDNDKKNNSKPLKSFKVSTNCQYRIYYWTIVTSVIFLGISFKSIYALDRGIIGKISIITGIPILRQQFFLLPLIMAFLSLGLLLYMFLCDITLKSLFDKSFIKYIKKTQCGFLFTNLMLFVVFYITYHFLLVPFAKYSGMKISGHVLAIMLSGDILLNLHCLCDTFIDHNINISLMERIIIFIRFLLGHAMYTLFWTSWVFHNKTDLLLSLLISIFYIIILHCCSYDKLLLNLIIPSRSQMHKKAKNMVWVNNTSI